MWPEELCGVMMEYLHQCSEETNQTAPVITSNTSRWRFRKDFARSRKIGMFQYTEYLKSRLDEHGIAYCSLQVHRKSAEHYYPINLEQYNEDCLRHVSDASASTSIGSHTGHQPYRSARASEVAAGSFMETAVEVPSVVGKPCETRDCCNGLQCQICKRSFESKNELFRHLSAECLADQLIRTASPDRAHRRRWKARARKRQAQTLNATASGGVLVERQLPKTLAKSVQVQAAGGMATPAETPKAKTWKDFPSPSQVRARRQLKGHPSAEMLVKEGVQGTVLPPTRKSKREGTVNVRWEARYHGT
eukprot:CAMPEP_0169114790 /NCGR_PEP_ID=MMETSP1015-20121227/28964_1 /TAXON_ID=342587 /ORGANISM="Karlodinium micrum, Strain CCMP2283" /LENGTH=304 /DNA_ID=CAMNT_0009177133 /DNA_START=283 /DNA_END=1194 /DNA_ORIENTATION=+